MHFLLGIALPFGLAIIMFSLGLGLTGADFRRIFARPIAFAIGLFNQVILVPLVAFVVALVFGLSPVLAVGLMIVAFCPGGVTSALITRYARGDVALSVSLTAVTSLASMLTLPPLLALATGYFISSDAARIDIGAIAVRLFLLITVPMLFGLGLRHFAPRLAARVSPAAAQGANAVFVFVVAYTLITNWTTFVENLPVLAPSIVMLILSLLTLGYGVSRVAGLTLLEAKTISLETGIQNAAMGITVAALLKGSEAGLPAYALPAAVYGILMLVLSVPVVLYFRKL